MLAPYHLIDVYARGALGEFAAFVWMPLIALGLEALPKRWAVPLLAMSFAGLILSNLPVALLVSIFLIAPFCLHRLWRDRSVLLPGALAGGLGVALAAFYLLPALTLQEHVTTSLLWGAYYKPSSWFLWNGPPIVFLFLLPPIALAMAMLSLLARSVWSVITVVAALAAVGLIPFVWDIPLLARTQFPWRLLCVVEFAAITALTARPPRPVWFALAAAVLMFPYLTGISRALDAIHKPVDEAELARVMPDAPEYLPRGFDVSDVRDLQRSVNLAPYRKLPRAPVIVVPRRAHVTLHRAAFPIWRVEKNGVDVPTQGPLISFDATPGVYRVVRVAIWQEWIGGLVSLAAAMLLAGWSLLVRGGPAGARRRPRTPATQS